MAEQALPTVIGVDVPDQLTSQDVNVMAFRLARCQHVELHDRTDWADLQRAFIDAANALTNRPPIEITVTAVSPPSRLT